MNYSVAVVVVVIEVESLSLIGRNEANYIREA